MRAYMSTGSARPSDRLFWDVPMAEREARAILAETELDHAPWAVRELSGAMNWANATGAKALADALHAFVEA
ncbi:MAG TPA: hypothetical protein VJ553_05595 [Candidatus Paceibacterota bacterium]|nr:MAG: hypothetical protein A2Y74_01455 [Actinobacteria bacterium RBG_13_63_9]HXK37025.1 hypothetical protein [Candidatus Paceibacterota bacterium]